MDPFENSLGHPISMGEAELGINESPSWLDFLNLDGAEFDQSDINDMRKIDSNAGGTSNVQKTDVQTTEQNTPATLSNLCADVPQLDSPGSLSNDYPSTVSGIASGTNTNARQPCQLPGYSNDIPSGTSSRATSEKAYRVTQLISAFKRVSKSKGNDDDADWVKQQGDSKIRNCCEETVEAIIARQAGNQPLCPGLSKRNTRHQQPNYESLDARFQAVRFFLETEKRACKRFQRDLGWPKRLADDPVYEHVEMLNNDEGNSARSIRDKQKKLNNISMLEGWKKVLAGKILTRDKVENYVRLAEYNVDGGKTGRRITPVKSGTGRGKDFDRAAGGLRSEEASSKAVSPTVSSLLLDSNDVEGIGRSASRDLSIQGRSKKRKLEDMQKSTPTTSTPVHQAGYMDPQIYDSPQQEFADTAFTFDSPKPLYSPGSWPLLADIPQTVRINDATTLPDSLQQELEFKWPIEDARNNSGLLTPQQVANAQICGVSADIYINIVRFQHGIPRIDWLAD